MRVVHISITPLAGSPIQIVKALRKYTDIEASLVVFDSHAYGSRVFEGDIDWLMEKDKALEAFENADILHFHHYFNLKNNCFGIDFLSYKTVCIR